MVEKWPAGIFWFIWSCQKKILILPNLRYIYLFLEDRVRAARRLLNNKNIGNKLLCDYESSPGWLVVLRATPLFVWSPLSLRSTQRHGCVGCTIEPGEKRFQVWLVYRIHPQSKPLYLTPSPSKQCSKKKQRHCCCIDRRGLGWYSKTSLF